MQDQNSPSFEDGTPRPAFKTKDELLDYVHQMVSVTGQKLELSAYAKKFLSWYFDGGIDVESLKTLDDLDSTVKAWAELSAEELKSKLELNYWQTRSATMRESIANILGYIPDPIDFGG